MKKLLISAAVLAMSLSMAFTVSAWHIEVPEDADQTLNEYFATAEVFPAVTSIALDVVTDYPLETVPAFLPLGIYAYDPAVTDVYYKSESDGTPVDEDIYQKWLVAKENDTNNIKYGDINSDDKINTADISLLLQGWKTGTVTENMDVYKDGNVNVADITILLDYVFGDNLKALPVIPE